MTDIVAGRVDASTNAYVQSVLKRAGSTTTKVINDLWDYIAHTGSLPVWEEAPTKPAEESLLEEFYELQSITPRSAYLEGLDAKTLNKELADRD